MFRYLPMICRQCGTTIKPKVVEVDQPIAADCYDNCNYRCPSLECAVAYSNAKNEGERRMIQPDFRRNVPEAVRDGLEEVLCRSLNERNRVSKQCKFAFESSEDAVTWTVFRYLYESRSVGRALGLGDSMPRDLWFWGVHWPLLEADTLRRQLQEILLSRFQEQPVSMSEPDLILENDDLLLFVEVKYESANDRRPGYRGFPAYLADAARLFLVSPDQVASEGYYELTRNWVVGATLAQLRNRRFMLVNLAAEACRESADKFGQTLNQTDDRRYRFTAWKELLAPVPVPRATWFDDYCKLRRLVR